MFFQLSELAALVAITTLATAAPQHHARDTTTDCVKEQRTSWHNMTNDAKKAYIDADLCLMSLPATMGFPGAQTRWDDLMFAHTNSTNVVHDVVCQFNPFKHFLLTYPGWISPMASPFHVYSFDHDPK